MFEIGIQKENFNYTDIERDILLKLKVDVWDRFF